MRIYQEKAGVISEGECWVCICEGYLYTNESLEGLIKMLNTEWKHDKHLVGYSQS
jgi:hypothetical protein